MKTFLHRREGRTQTRSDRSFVGGIPHVPVGTSLPKCLTCAADLTFFFQVAFQAPHPWQGHSLALFACTATVDEDDDDHQIPDMLSGRLAGVDVPRDFAEKSQRAYRILVFKTEEAETMPGYVERVAFAPLELESKKQRAIGLLNDTPKWAYDDETPATVAGSPAVFLFQLFGEVTFPIVPGAPAQLEMGLDDELEPVAGEGRYQVFLQNHVYFFGPTTPDSAVYVLPQQD